MALPRFQKLSAERRHRLLSAAAVEFAAKGFQGAALTAIAEKSGMGKASFYYYFADKADLCATVLDEAWRRFRMEGRLDLGSLTAETFWPSFEAATRENLEKCVEEPWLLAAAKLLNRSATHGPGEAVLDEYREKRREWEAAFIQRGQELGAVRSDVPADLLVAIALSARQASNLWILDRADADVEGNNELALHVFEIYRAILSPPAADVGSAQSSAPAEAPAALGSRRA
jgi:AcrR family transcriptional regulator